MTGEERDWQHLTWRSAWALHSFRKKLLSVSILFAAILAYYPYFFAYIQTRPGQVLNDVVLGLLPAANMSPYIFALIYITVVAGICRAALSPYYSLLFLYCCLLLSISRIITIMLVPLSPPMGLVPLVDPVLTLFYGHNLITKDLFYSGHTASVFLIFLLNQKRYEKIMALVATILVAVLLLVQHIHYFIDVISAPIFVSLVFVLSKRLIGVSPAAGLSPIPRAAVYKRQITIIKKRLSADRVRG